MKIENPSGKIRMYQFENDELVVELELSNIMKKYLRVSPSRIEFYWGLSDSEVAGSSGKNPFQFIELSFGLPLMSLAAAFPDGPATIPDGELVKKIMLQNNHPFTVKANRLNSQKFSFSINGTIKEAQGSFRL